MRLIGKPSISMGHLYHGYVRHNQRDFLGSANVAISFSHNWLVFVGLSIVIRVPQVMDGEASHHKTDKKMGVPVPPLKPSI